MAGDLLITNIGELATPQGSAGVRGKDMGRLAVWKDAVVLIRDGIIEYAGSPEGLDGESVADLPVINAQGRALVPGFVDSHTHFAFAGYRDEEFQWRAEGLPYMEIHRRGGGIRRSMEATRAAELSDLVAVGEKRLWTMLGLGVTTVEGKSGYGLDMATELKQLEAMGILADRSPVSIVPTFMGPHSTPPEYEGRTSDYMDFVIREVLPAARIQGIAQFADVFCEKGVFGIEDSRRYLQAAKAMGFGLKLHADEIERIGGAGLAAELGATSADHLLKASAEDIGRMAEAGVVATCLPLTAFTLREPYPDARGMIDSGCILALASDLNPGSCYSQSIPMIFAIASLYLGLSIEETLTALTLNGAAALGLADRIGSIEEGKAGDLVLLDAPSIRFLAYNVGMNQVVATIKEGEVVYRG